MNGCEALENDQIDPALTSVFGNSYLFRNDGRDELTIKIKPATVEGETNQLPDDFWLMQYTFIIRDTEDMKAANTLNKYKRLYFWDKNYQLIREIVSGFSTAKANESLLSTKPSQVTDEERKMTTGLAIYSLLVENGFSDYVIDNEFDEGVTSVFYTSPNGNTIYKDIQYLMKCHLSSDGILGSTNKDMGILNYDRQQQKLRLEPLSWFFKKAGNTVGTPGEYQIEHFFLEIYGDSNNTSFVYQAPYLLAEGSANSKIDIKLGEYGKIYNYQFVDMSSFDNSMLVVSHPTYNIDIKYKTFTIKAQRGNINNFKTTFKELYTKNLYGLKDGAVPLITLNKTKTENKSINVEYNYIPDDTLKEYKGLKKLLYTGVFLNECINFWVMGSTHRQAGRFYGIDRQYGAGEGKLAYKFYGQWLATEVKHIFLPENKYMNNITAIRIGSFGEMGINEGIN